MNKGWEFIATTQEVIRGIGEEVGGLDLFNKIANRWKSLALVLAFERVDFLR